MLDCTKFHKALRDAGIDFFTGVPDSLLKHFCAFLSDHASSANHVIAANEGGAVGLATGHYLATGRPAMVYMQNSGQGNAVNPLLSLCDPEVYGIPMLLLVGWRGEPGVHDEPQHVKQGRVMNAIFDAMEVPFEVLVADGTTAEQQVKRLVEQSIEINRPVALVAKKGLFSSYKANGVADTWSVSREQAIDMLLDCLPENAVVVATTGHISREVYACRERKGAGHGRDFLLVGGMGHASQVALGAAMAQPERPVFCFDGDGALLMHMGGMALVGQSKCSNLKHIVFNNGAHGSVGGQPTVARSLSLKEIAASCGYSSLPAVSDLEELQGAATDLLARDGPGFLEIRCSTAARTDLERPATSPTENKQAFMEFINGSE